MLARFVMYFLEEYLEYLDGYFEFEERKKEKKISAVEKNELWKNYRKCLYNEKKGSIIIA